MIRRLGAPIAVVQDYNLYRWTAAARSGRPQVHKGREAAVGRTVGQKVEVW